MKNTIKYDNIQALNLPFMNKNEIAILDFGSQYTHLIARRIRELGVVSHIYPNNISVKKLTNAVGVILSGGPRSIVRQPKLPIDKKIFKLNVPILGLCYGHQLIANEFGGIVKSGTAREYGLAKLKISKSPIFNDIKSSSNVWMSHGDHVDKMPVGFSQIATTGNNSVAAMANEEKKMYGFQFHPEVHHTKDGKTMLHNFVFNICKAQKNWTTEKMLDEILSDIKKQAKDKKIFLLISGGVDSTVCFALLEKALGKNRVYGLHVDHGMMRLNETKLVTESLKKIGLADLHVYNAEKEYLSALENIFEPEEKRKIIGDLFLDITDRLMKEMKMNSNDWLIGQGTIYPDTIESGGTKNADKIKTHHNRVPRILKMIKQGKIIEPIRELYKDEVREIGLKLGLPKKLIYRHPFPGPGLAIRCLCSTGSNEKAKSSIFQSCNLSILPISSVGVQGDERSYAHPALITDLPKKQQAWKFLRELAPQITNTHKDINRVLFLMHGDPKDLSKSKMNQAYLTKTRLDLLRKIDAIVNKNISHKSCSHIWQMPVVLVPFGHKHGESIVLRPVESEEAMTVSFAEIPKTIGQQIVRQIKALDAVDYIFYDITNKPPGTIEWE